MFKIGLIGAGALGSRLSIQLKAAGYDITLLDNWSERVNSIQTEGMIVKSELRTYAIEMPIDHLETNEASFDLIILTTKSYQVEETVETLLRRGTITSQTRVISMVSGLGHTKVLRQYIPSSQLYLAITTWPSYLNQAGEIHLYGQGHISLQRADGKHDAETARIVDMFNDAKLNASVSDDITVAIWEQAIIDSTIQPLCTIFDKTVHEFSSNPEAPELVSLLVHEAVQVAEAQNIQLDSEAIIQTIKDASHFTTQGFHYPSMHQDVTRGRSNEIDALNGQIVKYAQASNIKAPNHEAVVTLIRDFAQIYTDKIEYVLEP
ncbi:ketopantoate reductase family protein [Staphylococcus canis]|uniref:2-dehydropantoate 2-reductase n=1 Tax=Staphylococcus canis TaxID=2724942 RepID=A0ABS0TE04_9STAP|nr:2-dehydropantoate 2-reductase [Staphylococcus canis]MBI5975973.1 2-dehydropantoate 2-reductase [Staphylococcus canis]